MTTGRDSKLEALLDHLTETRGFDIRAYKRGTLSRRIKKRMDTVHIKDYAGYQDYLSARREEFEHLFNTILINVTGFFRDPRAWDFLSREVVSRIAAEKSDDPIRVWDVGCASGEEAYTAAMILAETLHLERARDRFKIYASDVDEEALTKARHAVYTAKEVSGVPPKLLDKYFDHIAGKYVFRKPLRRAIVFGRHDLLEDAPISRVDLLICRNTLMYFNVEAQAQILRKFHFALSEHGVLFLGRSEMLIAHSDIFVPLNLKQRLFTKTPSLGLHAQRSPRVAPQQEALDEAIQPALRDAAFHHGPVASLVVDLSGHLVLANDAARTVFGLSGTELGRPIADLPLVADLSELPGWIEQVRTELRPVFLKKDVAWRSGAIDATLLDVRIVPLWAPTGDLLGVKAAFIDVSRYQRLQTELERSQAGQVKSDAALQESGEELQSAVEELETTNEELQSATEELETTNEELQSSNEELETMNEELQSTNDELSAVNEQLRTRTDELAQSKDFLESVFTSLRVAVAVLDHDLHVTVWNRKAEDLWGLRLEEVSGKNFMNLDINLPMDQLRKPIRACLAKESETASFNLTFEVVNRRGKPILCRVTCFPLMNAAPGVVLLMEDTPVVAG